MNERPVALVTGASRGIGAATAEELARRGYDVTVLARTGPDLDRTAKSVQDAGGKSLVQCGDLADLDFAEAAVAVGSPWPWPSALPDWSSGANWKNRRPSIASNRKAIIPLPVHCVTVQKRRVPLPNAPRRLAAFRCRG